MKELLCNQIQNHIQVLKSLKKEEDRLVEGILKYYSNGYNLDSLKRALLYTIGKRPDDNMSEYYYLSLSKSYKSDDPIYHHNFKLHKEYDGSTPATYVFELKDIKYFLTQRDLYLKMFIKHLTGYKIKFTSLDEFTAYINAKTNDEIFELILEQKELKNIRLINHKKLKIKNIVVVLPSNI